MARVTQQNTRDWAQAHQLLEPKEYFKNLKTVVYKGDTDEAKLAIDLAFGKSKG